jgi:hypothetical protein
MKQKNFLKIAMLFGFALISNFSFGQVTENFDDWSDGSYGTTSTYGEWISNKSLTETTNSRSGKCVRLRNQSDSYLEYVGSDGNGKDGGVGVISFWYRSWDSSPTAVYNVQASINGAAYSNIGNQISTSSTTYTLWSHPLNNTENNIKIKIIYVTGERLKVDDFSITNFSGSTPGISLGTVSGNTNESGTTATFTAVLNAAPTSDVVVNVTSGDTGEVTVSPSPLTFTSVNWDQTQTITATGIDDASSDDNIDVTITVAVDDTSSDDNYDGISATTTVTNEDDDLPQIIISEIMYNSSGTDDEWIEVYNGNGDDVDISSWTIVYSGGTFTFPGSTTITNGDYITIALGSNGDGSYNNDNPFTPDFNNLSGSPSNSNVKDTTDTNNLGNASGTTTLKNGSGTSIDIVAYDDGDADSTDGDGPSYEIVNVSADNSVTSSNWQASAFNGGSPGKLNSTTWSGATDSDWSTSSNWSNGIPVATSDLLIPASLTNYPTASGAVTVNSVTINSGATLKAEDDFTGSVTYNRTVGFESGNLKGWYLMSSPVAGQVYDDAYVTANDIAEGTGVNRGIATYTTASDSWVYHQGAASATFTAGKGYSVKRQTNTGTVSFTGTLNTSDAGVDFVLDNTGNRINLLGNPYTSSISSGTLLANAAALSGTQTMWIYDQTSGTNGGYAVSTLVENFILAPGQGFFVTANIAGGTVNFAEANQSHNADTFQKTANTEIKVLISVDGFQNYAKVYYLDNATIGFDVGYEGELFGGTSDSFSIYTQLLTDNIDKKYQVQSLPNSDYENMVIPVGISADAGKEITFTADALNVPSGLKVFFEDRQTNTFTRLDETNSEYKVTLTETLNGVGRFYMHTTASVLSTEDIILNSVRIFKTDSSTLKITGLPKGKTSFYLYNILGKEMMTTIFTANGNKEISLSKLASGIYLAKIQTEKGVISKKIILE